MVFETLCSDLLNRFLGDHIENLNSTQVKFGILRAAKGKEIPEDYTFTERMISQVIKNLQVKIRKIHIRYEDQYTDRERPFAAGVTLNFETTDENWIPTIQVEMVKLIHKLISMNSLAFYWNYNSRNLFSKWHSTERIVKEMETSIARKDFRQQGYNYVLDPIFMTSRLTLNRKPESDGSNWTIPKVNLDIVLEKLALRIERNQYQDVLDEYQGHYKEWWQFAYKCVLEDIHRKRRLSELKMIPGAIPISSDDTSTTSTVGPAYDFEINGPLTIQALNQAAQQMPRVGQITSLSCGVVNFWHTGMMNANLNANLDVQQSITQAFIQYNQNRSPGRQGSAVVHDNAYIIVALDVNEDYHSIKYVFRQAGQNP